MIDTGYNDRACLCQLRVIAGSFKFQGSKYPQDQQTGGFLLQGLGKV